MRQLMYLLILAALFTNGCAVVSKLFFDDSDSLLDQGYGFNNEAGYQKLKSGK